MNEPVLIITLTYHRYFSVYSYRSPLCRLIIDNKAATLYVYETLIKFMRSIKLHSDSGQSVSQSLRSFVVVCYSLLGYRMRYERYIDLRCDKLR